jgi:hypothetical protein
MGYGHVYLLVEPGQTRAHPWPSLRAQRLSHGPSQTSTLATAWAFIWMPIDVPTAGSQLKNLSGAQNLPDAEVLHHMPIPPT